MRTCFVKVKESGFTLIELMISMGLLTFVMGISMNILSIVLEMTNDADYAAVITQESNYASERVKRLVRSAESFTVSDTDSLSINGDTLDVIVDGVAHTISVGVNADGKFILLEDSKSLMSSEVYIEQFDTNSVFTAIDTDIGVQMSFEIYHERDDNKTAGAFVYTQAIGRNKILN